MISWRVGVLTLMVVGQALAVSRDDLPGPWLVQVGFAGTPKPISDAAGSTTVMAGIGYRPWRPGLLGTMGLDADVFVNHGQGGALDRFGVWYVERIPLARQVYGGLGAGLWGIRRQDNLGDNSAVFVRPAVRALAGFVFPELPDRRVRPALEFAVTYAGSAGDLDLTTVTVALVLGF